MERNQNWFFRMFDLVKTKVETDDERAAAWVKEEFRELTERFGSDDVAGKLWLNVYRAHPDWTVQRRAALVQSEYSADDRQRIDDLQRQVSAQGK